MMKLQTDSRQLTLDSFLCPPCSTKVPRAFGTNITNIPMELSPSMSATDACAKVPTKTILLEASKPCPVQPSSSSSSSLGMVDVGEEPQAKRPLELHRDISAPLLPRGRDRPAAPVEPCDEYLGEIDEFLHAIEDRTVSCAEYMTRQPDVTEKMREILVDWLVEVHLRFKLRPETLYLTVSLIDRYLERAVVARKKLQLVGVTAMLVASKYEEIYAPEVKDFVFITDNSFSREEILDMEYRMLRTLEFNLNIPSSYRFMLRAGTRLACDEKVKLAAQYFLELSLVKYPMLKYRPSLLANASLSLARRIVKKEKDWDTACAGARYEEEKLRPAMKDLLLLARMAETGSLQAVRTKFASPKFMEVSRVAFGGSKRVQA